MVVCRVCAFDSDDSVNIFGSEGKDLLLAQKINAYLPIEVSRTDVLSLTVCRNCTTFLVAWDALYINCKGADLQLKGAYQNACNDKCANKVEWTSKTVGHDHSYNKNDSTDGTIVSEDAEILSDDKDQLVIQSIDLIGNDDNDLGNIDITGFQVESSIGDLCRSSAENPSKKRKILHFQVVNADGQTFSVQALEVHQDDDDNNGGGQELGNRSLEKDNIAETGDYIEEDDAKLNETEGYIEEDDAELNETEGNIGEDDAELNETEGNIVEDDAELNETEENINFRELRDDELEDYIEEDPDDPDDQDYNYAEDAGHMEDAGDMEDDDVEKTEEDDVEKTEEEQLEGAAPVGDLPPPTSRQKKNEPRVCDICNFVCKGNSAYGKHRRTHPPEIRNKCRICNKIAPNDASYRSHLKVHTDNMHPCDECGKILSSRSSLAVHKQTHRQERKYQCQICGKTTLTIAKLREHIQIHSDTRPYTCDVCFQSFKTQQCLKQHAFIHNKHPLFICELCGYRCHRKNHLTKHVASRHNGGEVKKPKVYTCCICTETFPSRLPLVQHIAEQHPTNDDVVAKAGLLQCKQCGKIMSTRTGYICHMASHKGTRHSCEFCNRSFATLKSLKYHILDHTGEKPFSCRTCGQQFKAQWLLQRHERVHTGERPYKCSECPMAFRCSMTLYQHKQIHSSVKKFKCSFCTYSTTRGEALRVHLRVHTDERPYPCTVCGWAFKQRSDCRKHMALHNRPQGMKRCIMKLPKRKVEVKVALVDGELIRVSNDVVAGTTPEVFMDPLDIKSSSLLTIEDTQLSMAGNTDSCD